MTKKEQKIFDATLQENSDLKDEVASLKSQLHWLQQQIFGKKSERFVDSDQLSLDLGVEEKKDKDELVEVASYKKKRKHTPHGREKIPAHLPRVTTILNPDYDITGLDIFDNKVTEYLEYIPPQYYVRKIIRPVYRIVDDSGEVAFVYAEIPAHCIDKGKAGASMVAQAIIAKCIDHTPLYRYSQQISRDCDFAISHTTLQGWYEQGTFWLDTIAQAIHQKILTAEYLQIDETTLKTILKPKRGKTKTAYMWLYYDPISESVYFDFSLGRGSDNLDRILENATVEVIQSDGWSAYDKFTKNRDVSSMGCMAHARRYFFEASDMDKTFVNKMMNMCQVLFALEKFASKQNYSSQQRLNVRKEFSQDIIDAMKKICSEKIKEVAPSSKLGKALTYLFNQWEALTYFLKDGRVELSNNWIENKIRPIALGRKNYLFAGSQKGGERLAIIYTVITTAQLHNLNVRDYLIDLFEELPKRKQNDIDDLLPWNWKPKEKNISIDVQITKTEVSKSIIEKDELAEEID